MAGTFPGKWLALGLAASAMVLTSVAGAASNAVGGTSLTGATRLAFVRGTITTSPCGTVYTMNADGSDQRPSPAVRKPVCFPSWSSDGKQIAFTFMAGKPGIYAAEADGSRLRQVTTGRTDAYPSWSPNRGMLVFARGLNLYAVSANGGGLKALTHIKPADGVNVAAPVWSPDGRHVAFQLTGTSTAVVALDLKTGSISRVGQGGSPSWSPDGKQIVFAAARGLEIVGLDGSKARSLTPGDGPTWSPDGRKIAYWRHASGPGPRSAVYVVNVDGSGAQRLSKGPYDTNPDWLPR